MEKMRWGWVLVCSGVVFSACGRGSRDCQCLERRAEFCGRASENRRPGRAILPSHPTLTQIKRVIAFESKILLRLSFVS